MSHISHFEEQERAEEEARRRQQQQQKSTSVARSAGGRGGGGGPPSGSGAPGTAGASARLAAAARGAARPQQTVATGTGGDEDQPSIWNFYAAGRKTPTSSRFLTRYQPYSRRISFQPEDLQIDLEDEENEEAIQQLFHRPWRVFRLSPLIGFQHSEEVLEAWAKSLRQDLEQNLKLSSSEILRDYQKITVSVDTIRGLRGCEHDSPAVRISVSTRREKTHLLTAFLLSVDRHDKITLDEEIKVAILPVMLISGAEVVANVVRENVQKCFDCVISPVSFSQSEFKWAAAMWVSLKEKEEEEEEEQQQQAEAAVKFVFRLPNNMGMLDLELKQSQLINLWKSIHDPSEYNATLLEMEVFHKALIKHVQDSVGVNLESLDFEKVDVPVAKMESHNKIQIETTKHAKTVLRFLTDICQLNLDSVTPRIGITTGDTIML